MVVVIANDLPPAVRGRMKLWFVEPRPNIFVSGIKDSVADDVVQYLVKSCPNSSGLMVFQRHPPLQDSRFGEPAILIRKYRYLMAILLSSRRSFKTLKLQKHYLCSTANFITTISWCFPHVRGVFPVVPILYNDCNVIQSPESSPFNEVRLAFNNRFRRSGGIEL